ncbi:CDP-alcohol phosphatidyltransferase family protein [Actinomadura sp. NPDC047616]|uniref:CDP-alcohol phosphatidyltransferase family protein n=1 Tax=Actinomadura sp. NPDC047616 TaxID=3155914 RepID=UPI0033DDB35E
MSRSHQGPVAGLVAQVGLLATLTATTGLGPVGWLAGVAHALAVYVALDVGLRRSGASGLGPADRVTLARMTLAGGVAALVADTVRAPAPVAVLVALAAVALVLDAVDGKVARRTGTVSALGARFDMESDAFLILALSVYVAGSLGLWVLAIGLMRYVFFAASRPLPWLNAPLPPSMARKAVAATQGVVLAVAAAGVLPHPAATLLVGTALAGLAWSFGRDIAWLHRNHRAAVAPVRPRVAYRLIPPVPERPATPVKQAHPAGTRG